MKKCSIIRLKNKQLNFFIDAPRFTGGHFVTAMLYHVINPKTVNHGTG